MLGLRVTLHDFIYARGAGIEPALEVLETPVLPLYEPRLRPVARGRPGLFFQKILVFNFVNMKNGNRHRHYQGTNN